MLYQEGWGVRTYAPAHRFGFDGFSPYLDPDVVEIAEAIPFAQITGYDVRRSMR
jgi:asparagine synthase (glutamine-hydrolysing)